VKLEATGPEFVFVVSLLRQVYGAVAKKLCLAPW